MEDTNLLNTAKKMLQAPHINRSMACCGGAICAPMASNVRQIALLYGKERHGDAMYQRWWHSLT